MNITTNQNRQLYVAKAYNATVNESSAVGTIGGVKCINDGVQKELYFLYKGADTVLKSDRIQLKNLDYLKLIPAADMLIPLKKVKVSLDANLNGGKPVVGQDYLLRITFRGFYLDTDTQEYYKYGVVHAINAMVSNVSLFYQEMLNSLKRNFAREVGATAQTNPYLDFSADATGITITEKEQEWTLGTEQLRRIDFEVMPTTIFFNGEDVFWAAQDAQTGKYYQDLTPAKSAATAGVDAIGNGKKIADLEYSCMGERGDQYRNMGWPNVIKTEYLVDPSKEYNVLEIHYAFTDTGVNSYRSEKDITIVAESAAVLNSLKSAIEAIINPAPAAEGGGH